MPPSYYEVISPVGARQPPVRVILIDALGECRGVLELGAFAAFLRDLAKNVRYIKVVTTSRREPDVKDALYDRSDVHRIDTNSRNWNVDDDIRRLIRAEMKRTKLHLYKGCLVSSSGALH